jgi:MFS family permease
VNPHSARDLRFLLAAMGLNSLPLGYTLVVLPIYLSEIGFSGTIIGAVSSVSAIANTIALIPFALAADKYGRKQFAFWGFLSATLAHILFAFTRDLNLLLLASAIGGVGLAGGFSAAVWTPAWTAMLAEKVSEEERTRAFAWGQGIWTIALTVGSGMGVLPAFLRSNFRTSFLVSFQYTFLIFAGLAILSGLLLFPIVETSPFPARSYRQTSKKFFPNKSLGQISKFSLTIGLVGLASGIALQLLSLWFKKMYGVNEAVLGPWFAAAEITSIAVVPVAPRLTKNLGSPKSVLTTQGLSAILLGSMVLAPTYQLAGIIFIVRNFFMNISWPVQQSYLMGTVTAEERASASAITSTIWGIGSSIGPIFAGYLLNRTDYTSTSAPLLIGSATYLVSALVFYFFFRRTPPPEEVKSSFSTEIA